MTLKDTGTYKAKLERIKIVMEMKIRNRQHGSHKYCKDILSKGLLISIIATCP